MTDTVWGDEIQVDGKRPAWLADDERIKWANDWHWGVTTAEELSWAGGLGAPPVETIRLPADHFAYLAIAKGFEPWGGGWVAPTDWDGDRSGILYRDGDTLGRQPNTWGHLGGFSDIIGYRKRAEPAAAAEGDTVTIARMTEAEARALAARCAPPWKYSVETSVFEVMKRLNLIREETRAERFARETGHEVTPAVEAALAWSEAGA